MSRSGYTDYDDGDYPLALYRGRVASATRGKRGQKMLRELLAALDAMPVKQLHAEVFDDPEGKVCALGALARVKGIDTSELDPEDSYAAEELAGKLDVSDCLTREVIYENDEGGPYPRAIYSERESHDEHGYWLHDNRRVIGLVTETPDQRWRRMRDWVARQIRTDDVMSAQAGAGR